MLSNSPGGKLALAALLGVLLAVALSVAACRGAQSTAQPQATPSKIDVPLDLQVQTGRLSADGIHVVVTPRIEGHVQVLATNEDSGAVMETSPVAAKRGTELSQVLALPLQGDESFIKLEVSVTDDAGNRFAAIRRLKVSAVDGNLVAEEVPLAPPMPPGTEATAEPVDDADIAPPLPGPGPQKHPTESQGLSAASPGTITVTGRWGYLNRDNNVFIPLPWARVEIWDADDWTCGFDDLLCTTYTDFDGNYLCTVPNDDCSGGQDIYTRVFSKDDYSVRVTNASGDLYYATTPVYANRPDGTLDVGTRQVVGDLRAAFYIYDLIADDAWAYLRAWVGWDEGLNLRVNWPDNYCGFSCYVWAHDQIHLEQLDRWDSDVILHEYGHFVMDQNWATHPPTPNCNPHSPGLNSSLGCAWSEGWATYLQAAIQNDPIYTDTENQSIWLDIENASSGWDDPQDEGSVMASLWDIHDPANEAHDAAWDNINGFSNNGIWRVSAGTDAVDVNDFWSDWQSVNNRILCQVAAILIHHGISATPCPDLVVDSVSNPPALGNRGDSFSVTDTTHNQGGWADPSVTRYYVSTNTTKGAGDTLFAQARPVPGMGQGVTNTGSVTVTIPASTADGTYYLLACADDTAAVAESNENNNCRASSYTITIPVPVPPPSRFLGDVTLNGSPAPPGTNVAATIGGNACGQTMAQANSTYVLNVASSGQTPGCGTEGATVNFSVAALAAGTGTWHSGSFTRLDLCATSGPDADSDCIPDSVDNCPSVFNPGQENTDAAIDNGPGVPGHDSTVPNAIADGQGDACETDGDIDNDGLPDAQDTNPLGAMGICALFNGANDGHPNPAGGDVTNDDDHDGDPASPMGSDASDNGPSWDTDNDGALDGYECLHGSNPRDVNSKPAALVDDNADNDGDGLRNGWERRGWGTSPTLVDSDGDGLGDCKEAADVNGNGVVDFVEDTMFYARAVLLPRASFGKTMDFDLDKNGVADFGGDLLQEARYAFHILPCQ